MLSALKDTDPRLPRFLSYDIACKYFVNYKSRMLNMPPELQYDTTHALERHAIPKYHIAGHESICHTNFGFDYMLGAGRTSGEGVEPVWIPTNGLAPSRCEMSPSARQESMDDGFRWWNWQRLLSMGK